MSHDKKQNPPVASESEAKRLLEKYIKDFTDHVSEGDLSEILLKGHLLVEHYLDHAMILYFDKEAKVHRKSFYMKVKSLENKNCFYRHLTAIDSLYSLNKVRNELAHRLDFEVTMSQIDTIGYHLGKDYILKRYQKGIKPKELLLWVMDEVISMAYYPIWNKALEEHSKKPTVKNKK